VYASRAIIGQVSNGFVSRVGYTDEHSYSYGSETIVENSTSTLLLSYLVRVVLLTSQCGSVAEC